jgi:hypothetical protein
MQYRSSLGSTISVRPSISTRTSGDVLLAAFFCLPGLFFRLLTLTAGPPSWLDCVTVPGTSRLGRRLAAVGSPRGDESIVGVWRIDADGVRRVVTAAGVADARRLVARVLAIACSVVAISSPRSRGGTVDLRETGLDIGGGGVVSSVLGATEDRATLAALVSMPGVEVSDAAGIAAGTLSFSGILIVPALC